MSDRHLNFEFWQGIKISWLIFVYAKLALPRDDVSAWSRGMIPASGAGGPGFDSPSGPFRLFGLSFSTASGSTTATETEHFNFTCRCHCVVFCHRISTAETCMQLNE